MEKFAIVLYNPAMEKDIRVRRIKPRGRNVQLLTDRELEIMREVASGRSNKLIGRSFGISEQTVKNHIAHVFDRLDVPDRTSAVIFLIQRRKISLKDIRVAHNTKGRERFQ